MIRWLGGLIGGALAIGAIVLLVGVPSVVAPVVSEPVSQAPVTAAAPAPEPAPAPDPEPEAAMQRPELPASSPAAEPVATAAPVQPDPEPVIEQPVFGETVDSLRWHAFWSPFRSQIAANGFVSQLQTVTGLDYRVIAVKPGVYEVAFGYHDEADIARNLARIATATGLDVPES